ncbi:MAG: chromosome segregation protein SMC [Verrucomicrobia bacterium]|nr:chromosome segregation protein SMC [Verrucomicrobiota bacterium]
MHLKSLTVLGFKSFADKTTLNFQPGITAIVGPNGCGKSNVADAVRWVLGEQSAKALRGSEMADVIFNGAEGRKPMSMAEASLMIGDVDQDQLKAAGVELAYNEVTLTRRVFRDGVSEYYINKTPCRLRDIQQLFMGTGVGRASYSILAQGHITQLLSSRPEDRRLVFEEAAGITRYKAQKREALRKLESTDQNLLRLSDTIREVKRQIGSLQRQAGKARRYKQLQIELQHLDSQLARHQYDVLQVEIRARQEQVERLRSEMEEGAQAVLRLEDELGQRQQEMSRLEREIGEAQQRGMELRGEQDQRQERIRSNEERLRELEQQNTRSLAEIAQAEERGRAAAAELAEVQQRLSASEQAQAEHSRQLAARREELAGIEAALQSQQAALRQAQSESFQVAQELTRARNEAAALEMQKQGNRVRLEKLSAEKIQLEEERARLEQRWEEFQRELEEEKRQTTASRGTVEERQARLRALQEELQQIGRALDEDLVRQARERSQLEVLEQLQRQREGFSAGTQAALRLFPDLRGALVDRLRVPPQYVVAVETALGSHLQLLLAEDPELARRAVMELKSRRQGRASVAALGLFDPADAPGPNGGPALASSEAPSGGAAGAGVRALDVVQADNGVGHWLGRLLGQTWIVSDLDAATRLWRDGGGGADFVTLTGEMLSRHGIFTGGEATSEAGSAHSPLARRNRIEELQAALEALDARVAEASRAKGMRQSELTVEQAGLQEAQAALRTREVAMATCEGECRALENARRILHQKIETVLYEIQVLAEQEQEIQGRRDDLGGRLSGLEGREREWQEKLASGAASLEELRGQREAVQGAAGELKVALAAEEQIGASLSHRAGSQAQRIRELNALVDLRRREIGEWLERRGQWETEIAELRRAIDAGQAERERVSQQCALLIEQRTALESQWAQRQEELRQERRRHGEAQERRAALELELAQKAMSVQNLCERIQQKYQLRLEDVRTECITITLADEGPARVETLTPEEMAARGVATDWEAVGRQVGDLQRRIEEMGPVNLVAIDEYEEIEGRHQFLCAQQEDLLKTKEHLLDLIQRINRETRALFTETFEKIRQHFGELFTEVFNGGRADLQLVDEADALESGIEILARPPGKQLKSISLLSGGEQTMTAVALLFAIYLVRPSPFCVLDELDAPLDESNINRFIAILKRFLGQSQFIIITHNKRTIAMANVMYGVTMQEHGISKLISMKLRRAEESGSGGFGDSGEDRPQDAPRDPSGTLPLAGGKGGGDAPPEFPGPGDREGDSGSGAEESEALVVAK